MRNALLKKTLASLLITAGLCPAAFGQDKGITKDLYLAATIPDSLKENADAVVRYSMKEITVKAPGKEKIKYHSIVTILKEKGDREAEMMYGYNKKYDTYSDIDVRIYNAAGSVVKKYHKSDMYDRSAIDDETIVTDDRILALRHNISSYPTTIEITYEEDVSSTLDIGEWRLQYYSEQAVQNAACKVIINPTLGFRYLAKNTSVQPEKGTQDNMDTYTWQVKNIKAYKPEDDVMPWQISQRVLFACNNFEFYGLPGTFDSWQNFGKWISGLNADVNSLSPQREAEIRKMTDTIKTDKAKARFLYNYLQQNMRYVSIQLGIGGLKPFPATFVDQKKYGDCKALSNYMYALLKAVNIPANYAIINAGVNEEPAEQKFPFNSFNHVIVCVPFKNDTTWLECTSSTQPFGSLGPFTENRKALLITEDGGKLVNTPRSTIGDNQFNSNVHLVLAADGSAKANLQLSTTGEYRSMYLGMASIKVDEQKAFMIKYLNMKQPSLFDLKDAPDKNGVKEINADLEYDRFCDVLAGDKQFYRPAVFDLWRMTLPDAEKRKNDYYFEHPMQKQCVTTIDLPQGFEVESLPTNTALKFSYGTYEANYKYDATKNQVISTVKFSLTNQVIPAAKYTEMKDYMDNISRAQNKKLVIKKRV